MLCPLENGEKEEATNYWSLWTPESLNVERVKVISCEETHPMLGIVMRKIVL